MSKTKGVRVFVGNIAYEADEVQLTKIFRRVGPVSDFRFARDMKSGRSKGFGFCEYPDVHVAQSAIRNLNKHQLHGRELIVDWADNEFRHAEQLEKVLAVQEQGIGNRINNLIQKCDEDRLQLELTDIETLAQGCQIVHQLSANSLLYLLSELQRFFLTDTAKCAEFLQDNPMLAHMLIHSCHVMGMSEVSAFLRPEPGRFEPRPDETDDQHTAEHIFTPVEEAQLKRRRSEISKQMFGEDFEPVRKRQKVVSGSLEEQFASMTPDQLQKFLRGLSAEEIAELPANFKLQAQALRMTG